MADKKIALVTGGSKGIGKVICKQLLEQGWAVKTCARSSDELQRTVSELKKLGTIDGAVLDLANRDAVKKYAAAWQGPLHALINNAAICHVKRIDEPAEDRLWDEVLDINLNGVQFLTRGLLKHIPQNGRIVNISSQLGQEARAGYGAYCASKFALIGLTKVWAKELGPKGITVNAVCPGWVKTDQAVGDMERLAKEKGVPVEKLYQEICEPLELRRFTEPEEVANLVSFLVSPQGSGVTGRDWLMNTVWNQS
ncbi:MAG: SDR family oxidoreductase [Archangiaceae bacterium]|nr:SDR family oxidoreductase [Archangiaceae bacterium]